MTLLQFVTFLQKHCKSSIKTGDYLLMAEEDKNQVYREIGAQIDVFLTEYLHEKELTKKSRTDFILAIETDTRHQFETPIELIEHIHKLANCQPILDCERVSLTAISGFCNDFINQQKQITYQEQLSQAAF